MKPRNIIIDTDPGIDDAAAITIAVRNPALNVQLISTVAANVEVEKTTQNALKLMEFFGGGYTSRQRLRRAFAEEVGTVSGDSRCQRDGRLRFSRGKETALAEARR